MQITFNNQTYEATYNEQTGYWEADIDGVSGNGGLYELVISGKTFSDYTYKFNIYKKQTDIKFKTNSDFIWIFDKRNGSIKEILEVFDYDITIDEETNGNSQFVLMKDTLNADSGDLIVFNHNGSIEYYGVIEEVQSQGEEIKKTLVCKYITNIFDSKIPLEDGTVSQVFDQMLLRIDTGSESFRPYLDRTTDGNEVRPQTRVAQKNTRWEFIEYLENEWYIRNADNGLYLGYMNSGSLNVRQMELGSMYAETIGRRNGLWEIHDLGNGEFYLTTYNYYNNTEYTISPTVDGNGAMKLVTDLTNHRVLKFYENANETMKWLGVEQQIKSAIEKNFTLSSDNYRLYPFIQVQKLTTTTPKVIGVSNVENGIYNLHTWLTNCTQLYNIVYKWEFHSGNVLLKIEHEEASQELIDTNAQSIQDYEEVFEVEVLGKVKVLTNTNTYTLYLKNDRTTTTDSSDPDLAYGKITTVFTEDYNEAPQTALDEFKSNSYNHNISFRYNKYIPIGTPIAIKTKNQLILDTYISSVKITPKNFYEYQCGNIRIKFIEKLLKERNKE